jgi:hypothetical protein
MALTPTKISNAAPITTPLTGSEILPVARVGVNSAESVTLANIKSYVGRVIDGGDYSAIYDPNIDVTIDGGTY